VLNRRRPFRLAVIDCGGELLAALSERKIARWQLYPLKHPSSPEELVEMRLSALLLDPAALGDQGQTFLERVCQGFPELAVIVCTGRSTVSERIIGLRLGADEWITKPCHRDELVSRIEAVSRRQRGTANTGSVPMQVGEIEIRPDQYQAFIGGQPVGLTKREFELLHLFAQKQGQVLERETIYQRVWGYAMAHGDRSVDVYVRKLRNKLTSLSGEQVCIHTHFGIGYRFDPERAPIPPAQVNAPAHGPPDAARRQPLSTR
jgi:DNA-binding response OmpR family regulator